MVYLRKTGKKGFTLVELIAVIAIIAIMAGIAIPLISHYVQSANADADAATAYHIENALKVAASEIKTGRATANLKNAPNGPTVKLALENMNQSTDLKPLQSGYAFYYNSASQTVGAFLESAPPAGYTELNVNFKLVDLGLISP